ncbi:MAG: CDP-alcohol phosphatidyltransferase family protein [Clostridia bacterium]|nr:CDP-alcohol phosphatidyltransferase family protein [Clostridia bacterium]
MSDTKKPQILSIPNLLSLFRLALIPAIVITLRLGRSLLSSLLLVLSGITDVVDGFIARRFHMVTPLGKALDPIADKLTLGCVLWGLYFECPAILPLLLVFAVKEVAMGVEGLLIIRYTGTTYSARWYGKLSTVLLYATVLVFILWRDIPPLWYSLLLWLCALAVLNAFLFYSLRNIKELRRCHKEKVEKLGTEN